MEWLIEIASSQRACITVESRNETFSLIAQRYHRTDGLQLPLKQIMDFVHHL